MQILDVYTKKEYECKICKKQVYYGKVANDRGELYTLDNKPPNGKFAKESNVLSCKVDLLVKDRVHSCDVKKINEKTKELDEFKEPQAVQNAQTHPNIQTAPSPLVKEMDVDSLVLKEDKRKDIASCKIINQRILIAMEELPKIVKDPHISAFFWYADQLRRMDKNG